MSRGSRGGFRGGRLKGGRPEWEIGQVIDSKPSALFPSYTIPTPAPPTEKETREMENYLKLRDEIHHSTIYTKSTTQSNPSKTYGEDQFNKQYYQRSKTDIDPFNGVPTYSEKYQPKARTIPVLPGPVNKELFPKELWATLEGKDDEIVRSAIKKPMKRKAALISGPDPTVSVPVKDKSLAVLDKLDNLKDLEDVDGGSDADDEDKPPDEEPDYDYEEDEDEMGGDYNAEIYFDGGEDEDDDGGDGGDEY